MEQEPTDTGLGEDTENLGDAERNMRREKEKKLYNKIMAMPKEARAKEFQYYRDFLKSEGMNPDLFDDQMVIGHFIELKPDEEIED
jgi:hypothetical protein